MFVRLEADMSEKREYDFAYSGNGWGHCGVCHRHISVDGFDEEEEGCPGPLPKKRAYDCCDRKAVQAYFKKRKEQAEKLIKEFQDSIKKRNKQ